MFPSAGRLHNWRASEGWRAAALLISLAALGGRVLSSDPEWRPTINEARTDGIITLTEY
jgi:hypothetical protein